MEEKCFEKSSFLYTHGIVLRTVTQALPGGRCSLRCHGTSVCWDLCCHRTARLPRELGGTSGRDPGRLPISMGSPRDDTESGAAAALKGQFPFASVPHPEGEPSRGLLLRPLVGRTVEMWQAVRHSLRGSPHIFIVAESSQSMFPLESSFNFRAVLRGCVGGRSHLFYRVGGWIQRGG